MKITLITLDNWGFNSFIVNELRNQGHHVEHVDFNTFLFSYPTKTERNKNFFGKTFLNKNVKKEHLHVEILKRLDRVEFQDIILMVKADYLLPKTIKAIQPNGTKFISFFNDNYKRAPNIKNIYSYFDEVYSFEKEDVERFKFKFKTNFIYKEFPITTMTEEYSVFNISTYDLKRLRIIEEIAARLDDINESYSIHSIGKNAKPYQHSTKIEYAHENMSLSDIENHIKKAKALLDVHRENQQGLTFRVFESLGYKKKLITTNKDIINYDFYDAHNILVIDKNNVEIPKSFFETTYKELPEEIYQKYLLKHWVNNVLGLGEIF
ncbi:MAG: hypothetical protein KC469_05975 [Flavobacteriaceae bacterium]|nr:hypothetical protein [Flavobacteriaceae bacterium]